MNTSSMFTLNWSDITKGLVIAVLGGFFLPIAAIIQTPGFDLFTADFRVIGALAINGAIVSFVGYIVKNFLSTEDGKVFGKIG